MLQLSKAARARLVDSSGLRLVSDEASKVFSEPRKSSSILLPEPTPPGPVSRHVG